MSSILPIQLVYPVRIICAYGYHFRSSTVRVSHRTTCGTTPRHIGPRGGKWVGLTPPPRIQDDLLSCVTITTSTHLTFVSAQFKHVLFLDLGAYILHDITAPLARRDHRKLKFGPRYLIKLDDEKSCGNLRKPARVRRAHVMH